MSPLAISLRFLQTQPDERLVALAQAGHERAFEALVRRYRSRLLAYCRRVAPRGTSPEDILQQGLLQAWRALSSGAEVRDARAWLYRIVHNVAITALRASGELADGGIAGAGAPGVEQVVEQRMAARDALAGLAALPDLQRQVMVSTALDGQSHEEIAAALGLTSGSVRGLIYRARRSLRAAAAAVMPAPVIEWALGDAGGNSAALTGAGSAGLGALVLKGGAVLAIGAVAGTTAIVIDHHSQRGGAARAAQAIASSRDAADPNAAPGTGPLSADRGGAAIVLEAARGLDATAPASGHSREVRVDGGGRHDSGGGGGGDGSRGAGGGSPGGTGGSPGGTGGPGDGTPGGGGDSGSGSGGGGDPGATTATSGSDGGGDHGATTTTSGGGGGSSGSSVGGSFSGTFGGGGGSTGSSDGGRSGGGSDGGSSTTTTTTTSTTDGGH